MKIEALEKLLKTKDAQSKCWIDDKTKKVNIVFNSTSKVYSYRGSIYAIAEKLELIPEVDIAEEAEKVARMLRDGMKEVEAPAGLSTTIRHLNSDLVGITFRDGGKDEFDRELSIYYQDVESHLKWRS